MRNEGGGTKGVIRRAALATPQRRPLRNVKAPVTELVEREILLLRSPCQPIRLIAGVNGARVFAGGDINYGDLVGMHATHVRGFSVGTDHDGLGVSGYVDIAYDFHRADVDHGHLV